MYLKSLFPPVPPLPPVNSHYAILGEQQAALPDYVAQIDARTGAKHTRSQLLERVYDAATALGAPTSAGGLGLHGGNMVAILSDNCLEYTVLVHALLVIATPFALFSTYATPREMAHSLTNSTATHMFLHASQLPRFLAVAREHAFPEDHIYIIEGRSEAADVHPASLAELIQNVRSRQIPREPVRPAGKDTLAYLVFSSGTTGLPKAVMVSHGNIIFTFAQAAVSYQESAKLLESAPPPTFTPVMLSFLPFFHSYGLHLTALRIFVRPTTNIIMPRWNIDLALDLIVKYRVNILPMIPSVVHQLVHSPRFEKTDLSSLLTVGSGAAYLPPSMRHKLRTMVPNGASVFDGYGMSEATLSIMGLPQPGLLGGNVDFVLESSGILLPGMEALILRADGTHCLPGEPGELYVKGGNVTLGYWNNPEATRETFVEDGWLRTGDIFKANARGTLWFEDRAKDTLKISGLQVSPAEIEGVLLSEPGGLVDDAAVAGVHVHAVPSTTTTTTTAPAGGAGGSARTTTTMAGERVPRAWVVLSGRARAMREDAVRAALEEWVRANLSKYKWLRGGMQFVAEIPKNATGKVLRRVLKDQYELETSSSRPKL